MSERQSGTTTPDDVAPVLPDPASAPAPAAVMERRMKRWRLGAVLSGWVAVVLAAALGITAFNAAAADRPPDQDSAEVGFVRDMFTHHEQAVTLGMLVRQLSSDPQVSGLAHDIVTSQAEQMGMMLAWQRDRDVPAPDGDWQSMAWMSDTPGGDHHDGTAPAAEAEHQDADLTAMGMATDDELSRLGRLRGTEAEVSFLQLMYRHHEGGLEMAEAFLERSDEERLSPLAEGIVTSQAREIGIITTQLELRGAAPLSPST